jgi:hypothetical protein
MNDIIIYGGNVNSSQVKKSQPNMNRAGEKRRPNPEISHFLQISFFLTDRLTLFNPNQHIQITLTNLL